MPNMTWQQELRSVAESLNDLLFQRPECWICGNREAVTRVPLCLRCLHQVTWQPERPCPICGDAATDDLLCENCLERRPAFQLARAVGPYHGPLGQAVRALKYAGQRRWAAPLAQLLVPLGQSLPRPSAIVPVPLHSARLKQRGYNQSARIAHELGRRLSIPVWEDGLVRIRPTVTQSQLGRAARAVNVKGAFAASHMHGPVWLVDDVLTTGATASAAAQALLATGATAVYVLVVAREYRGHVDEFAQLPTMR